MANTNKKWQIKVKSGFFNTFTCISTENLINLGMNFNRIQEVLDEQERSQRWLAKKIGFSSNGINTMCKNKTQPKIDTLFKIAHILQVSVCDLLVEHNPYDDEKEEN